MRELQHQLQLIQSLKRSIVNSKRIEYLRLEELVTLQKTVSEESEAVFLFQDSFSMPHLRMRFTDFGVISIQDLQFRWGGTSQSPRPCSFQLAQCRLHREGPDFLKKDKSSGMQDNQFSLPVNPLYTKYKIGTIGIMMLAAVKCGDSPS